MFSDFIPSLLERYVISAFMVNFVIINYTANNGVSI